MTYKEGVFITQFNHKKIIPHQLPPEMGKDPSELIHYKKIKDIFNDSELHQFTKLWSILENPEYLLHFYSNSTNDKKRPESYSSYHQSRTCIELSKSYLDYSIDSPDTKLRGLISSEIRFAFKDYTYKTSLKNSEDSPPIIRFDFSKNQTIHIDRDGGERLIGLIPQPLYQEVSNINVKYRGVLGFLFDIISNSGVYEYENLSLENIELSIENLINSSEAFRNNDPFIKKKIANITYADTYKLKKRPGDTEKKWANSFKEPLSILIENYYWIKFNPNLSVEKTVLDTPSVRIVAMLT